MDSIQEHPKLLVLTSRFPYPLEKGDKLRVFHQIRLLSQQFQLVLVSLHEAEVPREELAVLRKYCDQIYLLPLPRWQIAWNLVGAFLRRESLQVGYFYSRQLQKKIEEIIAAEQPDHLYAQLIRTGKYVRQQPIPKVLDYMDVFSGQMQRRADYSNYLTRWLFRQEARKMAALEAELFVDFDETTIISRQDRAQLSFPEKDKVTVIPNGIDTQFFRPLEREQNYDIVFVGNMGYHPNVVAARFLVKEIMPLIWEKDKNVKVLLAGARPTVEVRRLADSRVVVSGWVPDIREAYASGKVFVAPLLLGSGQQNKLLEAMSMGLPCITTQMVNNAIGGQTEKHLLLAEDRASFARQILALLQNATERKRMGTAAATFITEHFSWEKSVERLARLIRGDQEG